MYGAACRSSLTRHIANKAGSCTDLTGQCVRGRGLARFLLPNHRRSGPRPAATKSQDPLGTGRRPLLQRFTLPHQVPLASRAMAVPQHISLSSSLPSTLTPVDLRLQPFPTLLLNSALPFPRALPLHLPSLRLTRPHLPPLPLASSGSGDLGGGEDLTPSGGDGGGHNDLPPSGGDGGGGEGEGDGGSADGDDDASVNRKEALFVLAQLGRKLESLPADLAAAVQAGRVPGEIVRRFAELEKSPVFRWLLQFGGFKVRLLADDLFLAKVAMECGIGIFTKVGRKSLL
jgi:hypothetical protein